MQLSDATLWVLGMLSHIARILSRQTKSLSVKWPRYSNPQGLVWLLAQHADLAHTHTWAKSYDKPNATGEVVLVLCRSSGFEASGSSWKFFRQLQDHAQQPAAKSNSSSQSSSSLLPLCAKGSGRQLLHSDWPFQVLRFCHMSPKLTTDVILPLEGCYFSCLLCIDAFSWKNESYRMWNACWGGKGATSGLSRCKDVLIWSVYGLKVAEYVTQL